MVWKGLSRKKKKKKKKKKKHAISETLLTIKASQFLKHKVFQDCSWPFYLTILVFFFFFLIWHWNNNGTKNINIFNYNNLVSICIVGFWVELRYAFVLESLFLSLVCVCVCVCFSKKRVIVPHYLREYVVYSITCLTLS